MQSVGGLLLGDVPQAATLDQAVEVFGEICGVIARAFQGLRHQQDFEARCVSLWNSLSQMFLEECVADTIDVLVHLQNFSRAFEIKLRESLVNQVEHVSEDR